MKQAQKKRGLILGVIAVIIIIVLLAAIVFLLLSRKEEPEEEKRNVVVTPENVESILEEIVEEKEAVAPGYYTVTMNTTWHFSTGKEASYDAVVENVETNTNDVYFDIVLESDEEQVLYKSPVIPLGGRLEEITLEKDLDAGVYDCVVIYHLIDKEQNTLSTLRVTLQIIVEG